MNTPITTQTAYCIGTAKSNKNIKMVQFICEKEVSTCRRKEKQQNKIGQNLSLGRRRKEKKHARRKSLPDLKDDSPERLR
jgi:hypothetical protein